MSDKSLTPEQREKLRKDFERTTRQMDWQKRAKRFSKVSAKFMIVIGTISIAASLTTSNFWGVLIGGAALGLGLIELRK